MAGEQKMGPLGPTQGQLKSTLGQEYQDSLDHKNNTSNPHGVTAAQVGAYTRVPVANYATALAQATGTTPKIFVVAADETDGGSENYYYYEGDGGQLRLQF